MGGRQCSSGSSGQVSSSRLPWPVLTMDDGVQAQRAHVVYVQQGLASCTVALSRQGHGQGETFNQNELTAAHRKLPLGTKATVTNLRNGKKVEVESTTAVHMPAGASWIFRKRQPSA